MPLSRAKLAYQAIQSASESLVTFVMTNGTASSPINAPSYDLLNQVLSPDKYIQEIMCLEEWPWEDPHHCFSISDLDTIPFKILSYDTPEIVPSPYTTIQTLDSEGKMGNISNTFLIDISIKTDTMENI